MSPLATSGADGCEGMLCLFKRAPKTAIEDNSAELMVDDEHTMGGDGSRATLVESGRRRMVTPRADFKGKIQRQTPNDRQSPMATSTSGQPSTGHQQSTGPLRTARLRHLPGPSMSWILP